MELYTLSNFLTIAREKNMSTASRKLHISQSALSRQIKELEEEVGKPLFIRTNRELQLTPEGVLLKKRAGEIITLVGQTKAEIKEVNQSLNGELSIGIDDIANDHLFFHTLSDYREKHPLVTIRLRQYGHDELVKKISDNEVTFGILKEPAYKTTFDFIDLPDHNEWGIYMNRSHEFSDSAFLQTEDIKRCPIALPDQLLLKNALSGWIGGNFRNFQQAGTYSQLSMMQTLIDKSHLWVLGTYNRQMLNEHVTFIPLHPRMPTHSILVWPKYIVLNQIELAFLKSMRLAIGFE